MAPQRAIRVAAIGQDVAERVRQAVASGEDLELVGEAASISQLRENLSDWSPDVVILELLDPSTEVLEGIRSLKQAHPTKVIAFVPLSGDPEPGKLRIPDFLLETLRDCLREGVTSFDAPVSGFLGPDTSGEEIARTARLALNGDMVLHHPDFVQAASEMFAEASAKGTHTTPPLVEVIDPAEEKARRPARSALDEAFDLAWPAEPLPAGMSPAHRMARAMFLKLPDSEKERWLAKNKRPKS